MTPNVNMSFSPSVISFVLHSQKKRDKFCPRDCYQGIVIRWRTFWRRRFVSVVLVPTFPEKAWPRASRTVWPVISPSL